MATKYTHGSRDECAQDGLHRSQWNNKRQMFVMLVVVTAAFQCYNRIIVNTHQNLQAEDVKSRMPEQPRIWFIHVGKVRK